MERNKLSGLSVCWFEIEFVFHVFVTHRYLRLFHLMMFFFLFPKKYVRNTEHEMQFYSTSILNHRRATSNQPCKTTERIYRNWKLQTWIYIHETKRIVLKIYPGICDIIDIIQIKQLNLSNSKHVCIGCRQAHGFYGSWYLI